MSRTSEMRKRRLRLLRLDPRCRYCGHPLNESNSTLDHIIPRSAGGTDAWQNLVLCCRRCNTRKGDVPPVELYQWARTVLAVSAVQ